jgi:hypothetical protein
MLNKAVPEEHREAGEDPGAGSRTHSQGFLPEDAGGCNGLWRLIRKTFPRAGLEEMRRAGTCSGGGSGRHYQSWPPGDLEVARETVPEGIPEVGLERKQEFRKASGAARLASKRFAIF